MINDKEKKMIQRYCIYPKIAVVALIFSFVQCALIVPLEWFIYHLSIYNNEDPGSTRHIGKIRY